jgi:hypothetical protein
MTERQERHTERRNKLKALSKLAKLKMQEDCEGMTVNEILVHKFYTDEENTEFKTLPQWNKEGYKVKKGAVSFLVWGKPKPIPKEQQEQNPPSEEEKDDEFFPICYLFSNNQVEKK